MTELEQIFLTAAATLIGGTLLFVFSEFVKALVILPLQKYKEHTQLTLDRLDYYSNRLTNFFSDKPDEKERQLISQIEADLRSAATQLKSKYVSISMRKLLVKLKVIPPQENIQKAYAALIYLHNSILFKSQADEHNNPRANGTKIDEAKAALTDY